MVGKLALRTILVPTTWIEGVVGGVNTSCANMTATPTSRSKTIAIIALGLIRNQPLCVAKYKMQNQNRQVKLREYRVAWNVSQSRLWSDRGRAGSQYAVIAEPVCRARALPIASYCASQRHPKQPVVRGASGGCGPLGPRRPAPRNFNRRGVNGECK